MFYLKRKVFFAVFIFGFLFLNLNIVFAKIEGDQQTFFVEKSYDQKQRDFVAFRLVKISEKAYFYIESDWYLNITDQERGVINQNLANLTESFDKEIYPKLTGLWGSEWTPGIDNDPKITIVFEQLTKGTAGYFNDANEYLKQQSPFSNEKEMIYLSIDYLKGNLIKNYLSHEFTHLIEFNQKIRISGEQEEIWLSEARAEYSPFYLGYDSIAKQFSNLQQRINQFSKKPSDSLVLWNGEESDTALLIFLLNI